jgi:hypothetical protein
VNHEVLVCGNGPDDGKLIIESSNLSRLPDDQDQRITRL